MCRTRYMMKMKILSIIQSLRGEENYWRETLSMSELNERGMLGCIVTVLKIRLTESNAKSRHQKNFSCKGTLRQLFICLRPPPDLDYCLWWPSHFVGSESGQIQNVQSLQNMVSNRTQHYLPLPSHSLPVFTVLWHREGERGEVDHSVRSA